MRILTRYVLREFLIPLVYCLGGFVSIYVLFELFGSFSRLMDAKLPLLVTAQYFIGYLAPFFEWVAPAALMLATLYTMWQFCRHSEITAMRASGVGFVSIVKPLLAVAIVMAGVVAYVNEVYVPAKAQWAKALRAAHFRRDSMAVAKNVMLRNARNDRSWSAGAIADAAAHHLVNVRVTVNRPGGMRLYDVTAPNADYLDGEWWFTDAAVQHYDATGREAPSPTPDLDRLRFRVFPEFNERPDDFLMQNRDWSYYSVADRRRYLKQHPDVVGSKLDEYRYDILSQLLAPLACIIITLFAIPAGIATGRQSVFRGILTALGMFFAFYAVTIGCMILAHTGNLPPLPAAALPHALFLAIGARMFWKQR